MCTVIGCGHKKNATPPAIPYPKNSKESGSASAPAEEEITHATFDAAAADTRVSVQATEYHFELSTAEAKGPKVFFTVTNAGTEDHNFEVRDSNDKRIDRIAAFGPGQTKTLAVELQPGTYSLQCLVVKGVQAHTTLGMHATFTVT